MNPIFYTTLSQSKKLKELGIVQQSQFSWFEEEDKSRLADSNVSLIITNKWVEPIASAFSGGELGLMFGKGTRMTEWLRDYINSRSITIFFNAEEFCRVLIMYIQTAQIEERKELVQSINQRYLEAIK